MALGMSAYTADAFLNALANNAGFNVAQAYMKLHLGDPGAAGTTSPAVETSRKAVSFGASAAGAAGFRQVANDVAVSWVGIGASEDATHFSLWDSLTVGNYLGSGTITANAYVVGDTYTIAIGGATLTLAIAV